MLPVCFNGYVLAASLFLCVKKGSCPIRHHVFLNTTTTVTVFIIISVVFRVWHLDLKVIESLIQIKCDIMKIKFFRCWLLFQLKSRYEMSSFRLITYTCTKLTNIFTNWFYNHIISRLKILFKKCISMKAGVPSKFLTEKS